MKQVGFDCVLLADSRGKAIGKEEGAYYGSLGTVSRSRRAKAFPQCTVAAGAVRRQICWWMRIMKKGMSTSFFSLFLSSFWQQPTAVVAETKTNCSDAIITIRVPKGFEPNDMLLSYLSRCLMIVIGWDKTSQFFRGFVCSSLLLIFFGSV